ncbi:MAG: hypothetical protein M1823_006407, partial [Watsoniomyces obsoletus]
ETKKINATKHNLLQYVGGTMSIEMEMPKVLWLKNNMPKELFDRCKFYDLTDALEHLATGNENRSFCSVVCKQGYVPVGVDGSVKGWQEDFLKEIGLEELAQDNFKRMGGVNGVNGVYQSAGELAGYLSQQAASQLGLPAGIAVGSGVIDAYAGWIGTVGAKVSLPSDKLDSSAASNDQSQAFTRLAAVAGTSTCHLVMSRDPVFVPGVWGPYRDSIIPDFWMAEGGQSATGELLKHVLETHPAYGTATVQAESFNANIYDFLNEHLRDLKNSRKAQSLAHLGKHFFLYGDLFGNRSPIADPTMTGSVVGLSSDKSLDGLALYYYGTMEFIALQTHQIISTMNQAGHKISSIFMSGSQCQNDILMSLIATACDMPVLIPRYVHAAVCHGAAMLGAKAASADKDGKTVRWYALIVGLIDFALISYAFYTQYDLSDPGMQLVESYAWVPSLDLNWSVGADGLSMPLILLTGFITTLAILASWPVTLKPKLFYFLMLAMYGGQIAVFAVQDMLLFFLVWELELVPVYFLLSIWGGKKRLYAAT